MGVLRLSQASIATALVLAIAVAALAGTAISVVLAPKPIQVGSLEVEAGSAPNCITIELRSSSFLLNGTMFSGHIIIGFGGEFKSIHLNDVVKRGGRAAICFSEGVRRELTRLREIYRNVSIDLSDKGFVEGLSADDVVSRLSQRYASITIPTVSVTLWMYDSKGFSYVYTATISSMHFYMSKGLRYMDAFKHGLKDPMAVAREGVTVSIPPIDKLYPYLARFNITPIVEKIEKQLNLTNRVLEVSPKPHFNTASSGAYIDPDGYIYNYWQYPTTPPQFWKDRVTVTTQGIGEDYIDYWTWQNFISLYGSAYLFNKSKFPTPDSVRNFLNGATSGECFHEGAKSMYFALNYCLNPGSYTLNWIHTLNPGTTFTFYKPYVISIVATTTPPAMKISLDYASANGGYDQVGVTFMGALIWGYNELWVQVNPGSLWFVLPQDYDSGYRYGAIIIPSDIYYYGDVLLLTYDIRSYNNNYWIAIPIATIIPFYTEDFEYPASTWAISFYDINGNCKKDCEYVGNIVSHISTVLRSINVGEYVLWSGYYYQIPVETWQHIDSSNTGQTYVGSNYPLAATAFGIFTNLLSMLFEKAIEYWVGDTVSATLGGFIINFISFTDITINLSASVYRFDITRESEYPYAIPITIEKLTLENKVDAYYQINKMPLCVEYIVEIGYISAPPGAT
jgi:hypothetical protein